MAGASRSRGVRQDPNLTTVSAHHSSVEARREDARAHQASCATARQAAPGSWRRSGRGRVDVNLQPTYIGRSAGCAYLHPYGCQRMTRGQDGLLVLSCKALSSATPGRFHRHFLGFVFKTEPGMSFVINADAGPLALIIIFLDPQLPTRPKILKLAMRNRSYPIWQAPVKSLEPRAKAYM